MLRTTRFPLLILLQSRVCDVVVCSAGLSHPGYFLEQSVDVFRQEMELNYFGTLNTVKAAVPLMIEADNVSQSICLFVCLFVFGGGKTAGIQV